MIKRMTVSYIVPQFKKAFSAQSSCSEERSVRNKMVIIHCDTNRNGNDTAYL